MGSPTIAEQMTRICAIREAFIRAHPRNPRSESSVVASLASAGLFVPSYAINVSGQVAGESSLSALVPEPGSLSVVVVAGLGLLRRYRRTASC